MKLLWKPLAISSQLSKWKSLTEISIYLLLAWFSSREQHHQEEGFSFLFFFWVGWVRHSKLIIETFAYKYDSRWLFIFISRYAQWRMIDWWIDWWTEVCETKVRQCPTRSNNTLCNRVRLLGHLLEWLTVLLFYLIQLWNAALKLSIGIIHKTETERLFQHSHTHHVLRQCTDPAYLLSVSISHSLSLSLCLSLFLLCDIRSLFVA